MARDQRMEFPWKVRVTRRRERNKGGELQETRDTFVVLTDRKSVV